MVALRDAEKKLIGYYEKHEYRDRETAGRYDFTIHYDRQQLADYLNVDRTALSKELSKMRDDGLISFKKNQFSIKSPLHE